MAQAGNKSRFPLFGRRKQSKRNDDAPPAYTAQSDSPTLAQSKLAVHEEAVEITDFTASHEVEVTKETRKKPAQSDAYDDTARTQARYKIAVTKLEEALQGQRAGWKTFEFPYFSPGFQGDPIPLLQEQITKVLDARRRTVERTDFWSKGKQLMERAFKALSPITKNFLIMTQNAAMVRPIVTTLIL
jgi:hypothetical protein